MPSWHRRLRFCFWLVWAHCLSTAALPCRRNTSRIQHHIQARPPWLKHALEEWQATPASAREGLTPAQRPHTNRTFEWAPGTPAHPDTDDPVSVVLTCSFKSARNPQKPYVIL